MTNNLEKRTEIGENEYLEIICNQAQIYFTKYQKLLDDIRDVQDKIYRGYLIKFYTDGKSMWYEAKEKKPAGFGNHV